MEPISALVGVMAALPQCIQSAKELYDLRSRYKDASILITAIYSESMVIAASLSQVQNLLQHDALLRKPQLLETFDRALTGCRVVYGCLEEEVRDLVAKAENDDLRFKDRAKFLWKEDTFKELLTQIRGQQSALSLLIQGLQMESIADIRKLVADNSVTLDQVVKRSRTLRQMHPRLNVPESIFNRESEAEDVADADSIMKSAEFEFDDEVINSKAYRRAMALYTSQPREDTTKDSESHLVEDDLTAFDPVNESYSENKGFANDIGPVSTDQLNSTANTASQALETMPLSKSKEDEEAELESLAHLAITEDHENLFDSLEQDILAFMPRITSTAPQLSTFIPETTSKTTIQRTGTLTPAPLRKFSEGKQPTATDVAPPLPPRRPSGGQRRSESMPIASTIRSAPSDDSIYTSGSPSILSKVSTSSSYTVYEASQSSSMVSRKPLRKPLPISYDASSSVPEGTYDRSSVCSSPVMLSSLESADMHAIWSTLLEAEQNFVDRMTKLRKMFYDNIIRQWPILEKHLEAILVGEQLAQLNQDHLLEVMKQQTLTSESAICDPVMFEVWTNKSHRLYREYCQRMPHAVSSLRTTQIMDPKFSPFVNTLGLSIAYFGMGWEDYLKLPNSQLQSYVDNIRSLVDMAEKLDTPAATQEATRLKRALEAVTWLRTLTSTLLEEAQNREDIQNIEKRIHTLDASYLSQLNLLEPTRRVRHQGGMALKLKSQGPWHSVHVMLLDNFLVWGKTKSQKKSKGDKVLVLDAPIAISDLELSLPCDSHQFQKATMFDEIPRGSVVYVITVKNKNSESKPHLLGSYGFQERQTWWDHFLAATSPQGSLA